MASISYLVVGGGAGGGSASGTNNTHAGGGAGAEVKSGIFSSSSVSYTITVGAGGNSAAAGSNSSLAGTGLTTVTATGGAAGGNFASSGGNGGAAPGGGGGGNAGTGGSGKHSGGTGATGSAGAAGAGAGDSSNGSAGVGAGAGGIGGTGGGGTTSSISGAAVGYGGGGGGAAQGSAGPGNAPGGGGDGALSAGGGVAPVAGTANRGGGGGGGCQAGSGAVHIGAVGGSGVVILSYATGSLEASGGTITTSGGNTIHTFVSSGTLTVLAPLAVDATIDLSATISLTALNRFTADVAISVSVDAPLRALSSFTGDLTVSLTGLTDLTARSATAITLMLGGVDVTRWAVEKDAVIDLNCNGTPDAASVKIRGGPAGVTPQVGQQLTVLQAFTPIFDGEVTDLALEQEAASLIPFWRVQATDFGFLLKRRLVTQTWFATDADVIARALANSAGFTTTNVQAGLPPTTLVCVCEDPLSALNRLAQLVNASWRFNSKDLYFRGTSNVTAPATLNDTNRSFQRLRYRRRIGQAITRAIVQGGGTLGGSATVVAPGATAGASVIPLTQSVGFAGGDTALITLPISGSYPVVQQSVLVHYTGTILSSVVIPPVHGPFFVSTTASGNAPLGSFYYALTYVTSAGETGRGPLFAVTVIFYPGGGATGTINLDLSGGFFDSGPPDATVAQINVYRSVVNGNPDFLFFAGSYRAASYPAMPWPNPRSYADSKGDNELGGMPPAAGATCPQGAKPPYGSPPGPPDFYFPALTGVVTAIGGVIVPALPPGATVTVCSIVNDATKQTALATMEGTDGVREGFYPRGQDAANAALAAAIGQSILAGVQIPEEEATFQSQDSRCVPLAAVPISLAGVSTTLVIQAVRIAWPVTGGVPHRTVRASSQYRTIYHWLRDVNRLLIKPAA